MKTLRTLRQALLITAASIGGFAGVAISSPAISQEATRAYSIPAQDLDAALRAFALQSTRDVLYPPALVQGKHSRGARGQLTESQALDALLARTGLEARRTSAGGYTLAAKDSSGARTSTSTDGPATELPEILVRGGVWSLNTGIKRSENDSQPFVVITQEDIKRSGAQSLESFFRDFLPGNASPATGSQSGVFQPGRSIINLRGLGSRETLILVDGRRQPGVNNGSGDIEQPSIRNISLASIERIEVLASSASGLYGQGATGGVINIILRRDFSGSELVVTYADSHDFASPDFRADFTAGRSFEDGRTNVSLSASWRESKPLYYEDRLSLFQDGQARALANDPDYFSSPPLGTTPNIHSFFPLRLDPAYGGGLVGSNYLSVPTGYRGVALDGVGPLLTSQGQYNLEAPDTAAGLRSTLIEGSEQKSVTGAVRREFTSWLTAYLEGSASRSTSERFDQAAPTIVSLSANAPNNPFQQNIRVAFPTYGPGASVPTISETTQYRLVGGATAKLPYGWQGGLDYGWSRSEYAASTTSRRLTQESLANLSNGTFDILRGDTAENPFPLEFSDVVFPDLNKPSFARTVSLRAGGPLPVRLWGGRPTLAVNFERIEDEFQETYGVTNSNTLSTIRFSPARSQTVDATYLELRLPLVSPINQVPFVEELELLVAARSERYEGVSSGTSYQCYSQLGSFPAGLVDLGLCDQSAPDAPTIRVSGSHVDPTVSLKWRPIQDLTFRASFATGYLSPRLGQLIGEPTDFLIIQATDPERGGEAIGDIFPGTDIGVLPGLTFGNPTVRPETSETWTAGVILTPRFLEGLRFSIDWTRIEKKDNIFQPDGLLITSSTPAGQAGFETFLRAYPDRFTRGPASGGFAVGPITSIDASFINFAGSRLEALDFAADYTRSIWSGQLTADLSASWVLENKVQPFPGLPEEDYTDLVSGAFASLPFGPGGVDLRGNASLRWSNDVWSLGVRARYIDSYYLTRDRSAPTAQGSATVGSQTYWDLFGSYQVRDDIQLLAGVNNVFNKTPPFDAGAQGFVSPFGDRRLANFYATVRKSF